MPSSHSKSPNVFDLSTHIEVNLCDQDTVADSRKSRGSWSIWCCYIWTAVEVSELSLWPLLVSTGEYVWIYFSTNSVDIDSKVMVSNSSVSSLNGPQGFRQTVDCGGWINNNFGSIQAETHPVQRMMPTVANVASNFTELCIIDRMSTLTFHVVSRLVKVTNSWDMSLFLLT